MHRRTFTRLTSSYIHEDVAHRSPHLSFPYFPFVPTNHSAHSNTSRSPKLSHGNAWIFRTFANAQTCFAWSRLWLENKKDISCRQCII